MNRSEIKVGGFYRVLHNEEYATVKVLAIRNPKSTSTKYDVIDTSTGIKSSYTSAKRFLRKTINPALLGEPLFKEELPTFVPMPETITKQQIAVEGENRTDPTALSVSTPVLTKTIPPVKPTAVSAVVPTHGEKEKPTTGLMAKLKQADTSPHLIVEARAGSGKTTTLIQAVKALFDQDPTKMVLSDGEEITITPSPQQQKVWDCVALSKGLVKSVCFVAFNKSIATELERRVPTGCQAMTMHSMGFKAVTKSFKLNNGNSVNKFRVSDIIASIYGKDIRILRKDRFEVVRAIEDLVGLCKMNLVDSEEATFETLMELVAHYGIEMDGRYTETFDMVPKVLERCKDVQADGCIDYDDMIWLPVVLDIPMYQYDILLIDESQDLNRCQQALARKTGKRLILCGDPKQAIYGFAGADSESMKRMTKELAATQKGCVTLPLTVTRRCGKAIVKQANAIVPDFYAHESCSEGKVTYAKYPREGVVNDYTSQVAYGDMVLCRLNAPLVSQCFRFLRMGKKANIQGRDVGQGLISTIRKLMKAPLKEGEKPIPTLINRLVDWLEQEQAKELIKKNPSGSRMIALSDRATCIRGFTEMASTIEEVIPKIETIFSDTEGEGIKLSSVHKAKGLEAKRVFILAPAKEAPMPHPMAKSAWQVEQEMNLKYVAITRAIEELVWVI